MLSLVLVVLAQGPGSTLEVTRPAEAPQSTLSTSAPSSDLKLTPLEGRPASSIQVQGLNALVIPISLAEGRRYPCEHFATIAVCDDLSVMKPELLNEPMPLSDGGTEGVNHISFTALKPGRTTCSCGQPKNLQYLYEFTVGSLEDAVRPVARKVVGAAFTRLYTHRRSQVP
ncbi:MAG: hypothetical protein JNM69_36815 [Archangium sp.]|nr:hypothetical protein [Archangium sp.]